MNGFKACWKSLGRWSGLYCVWAILAVGLPFTVKGFSPENITRLLTVAFLLAQVAIHQRAKRVLQSWNPRTRFIFLGTLLAAVVEGFHMTSKPVFDSIRCGPGTHLSLFCKRYLIDLAFTVPAYLVIFRALWSFITRYRYGGWEYAVLMGVAQTLGDGGIFYFPAAPPMLLFIPYPMTNYHACNVLPFLAVRDHLPEGRDDSWKRFSAIPGIILVYLICGATIKIAGKICGFE